jgi:hypothetical protein
MLETMTSVGRRIATAALCVALVSAAAGWWAATAVYEPDATSTNVTELLERPAVRSAIVAQVERQMVEALDGLDEGGVIGEVTGVFDGLVERCADLADGLDLIPPQQLPPGAGGLLDQVLEALESAASGGAGAIGEACTAALDEIAGAVASARDELVRRVPELADRLLDNPQVRARIGESLGDGRRVLLDGESWEVTLTNVGAWLAEAVEGADGVLAAVVRTVGNELDGVVLTLVPESEPPFLWRLGDASLFAALAGAAFAVALAIWLVVSTGLRGGLRRVGLAALIAAPVAFGVAALWAWLLARAPAGEVARAVAAAVTGSALPDALWGSAVLGVLGLAALLVSAFLPPPTTSSTPAPQQPATPWEMPTSPPLAPPVRSGR